MAFFSRSKNRKLVFFFVLLIVIVGVGGYFLFNNLKKASAEWAKSQQKIRLSADCLTEYNANALRSDLSKSIVAEKILFVKFYNVDLTGVIEAVG